MIYRWVNSLRGYKSKVGGHSILETFMGGGGSEREKRAEDLPRGGAVSTAPSHPASVEGKVA